MQSPTNLGVHAKMTPFFLFSCSPFSFSLFTWQMGVILIPTSLDHCDNKGDSHDSINSIVQCFLHKNGSGKEEKEEILAYRQWWFIELVPPNAANNHQLENLRIKQKAYYVINTPHFICGYLNSLLIKIIVFSIKSLSESFSVWNLISYKETCD